MPSLPLPCPWSVADVLSPFPQMPCPVQQGDPEKSQPSCEEELVGKGGLTATFMISQVTIRNLCH